MCNKCQRCRIKFKPWPRTEPKIRMNVGYGDQGPYHEHCAALVRFKQKPHLKGFCGWTKSKALRADMKLKVKSRIRL